MPRSSGIPSVLTNRGVTPISVMSASSPGGAGGRPSIDHGAAPTAAAEGHEVRGKHRLHAGQRLDALHDLLDAPESGVRRLVRLACHVEPHRHQRPGVEAELGGVQVLERADEQQRAHERDQRQRHLRHDQRAAEPRPAAAVAARAFLQRLVQIAARDLQRGKQPEDQRGDDRDERPCRAIDRQSTCQRDVIRHLVGRHRRRNQARAAPRRARCRAAR